MGRNVEVPLLHAFKACMAEVPKCACMGACVGARRGDAGMAPCAQGQAACRRRGAACCGLGLHAAAWLWLCAGYRGARKVRRLHAQAARHMQRPCMRSRHLTSSAHVPCCMSMGKKAACMASTPRMHVTCKLCLACKLSLTVGTTAGHPHAAVADGADSNDAVTAHSSSEHALL